MIIVDDEPAARWSDDAPIIVFVTAHDRYAIDAFEVSAIDYLLKPFDEGCFVKTLERMSPTSRQSKVIETT